MNILAFDTASDRCAVALWRDGAVCAETAAPMERDHARALLPMIEHAMDQAGLRYDGLDLIAVTVGPGSFTGLRVGLSAARGLALGAGLPLIGLSNFQVLAAQAREAASHGASHNGAQADMPILVALETKRADLYIQIFTAGGAPRDPAAALMPETAAKLIAEPCLTLAGDGAARLKPVLEARGIATVGPADILYAAPGVLAALAASVWDGSTNYDPPAPFYLRAPHVNAASTDRRAP